VLSWLAIDRPRRAGLGPLLSLPLGLVGIAAAGSEFLKGDVEARLLAPAHLLAYFVWIIVLQRKEHRHYWMLLGLSVLQIALATLLSSAAWLGLAMVAYATLALWTMGIFTLHRAVERIGRTIDDPPSPAPAARIAGQTRIFRNSWRGWRESRSFVRNAVQVDPDENVVGWRFAGGASVAAVLSLFMAAAFFVLIPRVWTSQYQLFDNSPIAGARTLTGFTPEVILGDMGEILESDDLVLEIELFDEDSGEPVLPGDYFRELGSTDPLFRGQVLERYYAARWTRDDGQSWGVVPRFPTEEHTLRQRVRLQPIGSPMLFGAGRVLTCASAHGNETLRKDPNAGVFQRSPEADTSRPFEYDAWSSRREYAPQALRRGYSAECLRVPGGMERIRRLSADILESNRQAAATDRQAAELLESYLRDSPEFSYSLDLSIEDASVDPVVDFLFNRRRGHCEYYASALTLMLRCVGIPARMVSGFKGGQINPRTGRFEVRQLHAHAWTEAYVGEEWIALDPTPPARDASVAALQEKSSTAWSRLRESLSGIWTQGVRLSKADQEELVYAPLRQGFSGAFDAVRDLRGTGSRIGEFVRSLASSPDRWFSWRGGVAAFVLLLLTAGLTAVGRRVVRWLKGLRGGSADQGRSALLVPFYERFRRAAARAGMERRRTQTQHEFAVLMHDRIRAARAPDSLAVLPASVTRDFYRVRFGGDVLTDAELAALQQRLDDFEAGIERFRQNGSAPIQQDRR
jgi:hypothetical protein